MVKQGYKQTEIGVIPEDWEVSKLGDIGHLKNGINKDKEKFGYGVSIIGLLDIFGVNHIDSTVNSGLVDASIYEQEDYSVKEGDVLFVRSSVKPSGIGLTAVVTKDLGNVVFSGFLLRYRTNNLTNGFKRYVFSSSYFRSNVIAASTASANTNINQDNLKQLYIAYPVNKKEQNQIAEALSDVDSMISSLEKLIAKKKAVKQGTMQELLTGKKRLPGFTGEWVKKKVEDIIVRFATGLNPRQNFKLNNGGTNYYVTIKDFREGKLFLDDACDHIDDAALKRINERSDLKKDDVLFSSIGRIGDAYLITETPQNWNINESVFALRPNVQLVNPLMLYYLLTSEDVKNKLLDSTTGSTLKSIKLGHLKETTCRFPQNLNEQAAIASILSDMDNEIEALEQKLAKTRQLKQGMMQQLLTGKIRFV